MRDSWFERLVEQCVRSRLLSLLGLERQHVLRAKDGVFIARVDLAVPAVRLAIEAHSRQFHFGRRLESGDEDRDLRLSAEGWEVAYVGYRYTERPAAVRGIIEAIVRARAEQFGLLLPGLAKSRVWVP